MPNIHIGHARFGQYRGGLLHKLHKIGGAFPYAMHKGTGVHQALFDRAGLLPYGFFCNGIGLNGGDDVIEGAFKLGAQLCGFLLLGGIAVGVKMHL